MKMVWSNKFCTLEIFLKNQIPSNFDGLHGRESISVDFIIKYILCNGRTKC